MRFLRHLVIAFIAVALPLQGYAAVAMVACGPAHARAAGASHGHGATGHAAHDHAAHGHHADDAQAAAAHANHGHPAADGGTASPAHHDVGCSACASCCSGSAVSSPLASLAGFLAAHFGAIPFTGRTEQSVVPDGLERPPRIFLA